MKKNFSGAVVLLIAVALFLSTAATAETIKETNETKIVNASIKTTNTNPQDPVIEPAFGDVIFSQRYYEPDENWDPISPEDNLAFELTGEYATSIDVEKYVYDSVTTNWVDADTESTAQGITIGGTAEFKIIIHNDGDYPLYNIGVVDTMLDGLTYISADPAFDDMTYDPPYWYFTWAFPGPLMPCNIIEIYLTASVQGPESSINFNSVEVIGFEANGTSAYDNDFCYVMSNKKSKTINMPFLNFLESHPTLFPLLRQLLGL